MSPVPTRSTRECLEHAAASAQHRSADILLVLAELEQELGWDQTTPGLCTEHQAVANRLAELHLLVDHLAANLRCGHGVPPTPAAAEPRKSMRPVVHLKASTPSMPGSSISSSRAQPRPQADKTQSPQTLKAAIRARERKANGLVNAGEAAALTGRSESGWSRAVAHGQAPQPHTGQGRGAVWRLADMGGVKPERGR